MYAFLHFACLRRVWGCITLYRGCCEGRLSRMNIGRPYVLSFPLFTHILMSFVFLTAIIPIPRPTKRIRRRFPLNGGIVRPVRSADCELDHARVLVTHDGSGDR